MDGSKYRPLLIALVLMGCGDTGLPADTPAPRLWAEPELGLSFELPPGWFAAPPSPMGRTVLSGPEGSDLYFTTVAVQAVSPREPLGIALAAAYRPAATLENFAWEFRDPVSRAGRPGIRYGVRFDLHETPRRKSGLLLDTGRTVVDISYGAPAELFHRGVPEFEGILGSLWLD